VSLDNFTNTLYTYSNIAMENSTQTSQSTCIREVLADYIVTKIREISERNYGAAWKSGIEFQIWEAIQGDPTSRILDEDEVKYLKIASDTLNMWATREPNLFEEEIVMIPISEWKRKYETQI